MTIFRTHLTAPHWVLLATLFAGFFVSAEAIAQTTLSDRYKQLPDRTPSAPGLEVPERPAPATIIALWDLRQSDVSTQTLVLANSVARDQNLYPSHPSSALGAVLESSFVIGFEWIVDRFADFTATGRCAAANSLHYNPAAESTELLVALLGDERHSGYPRNPELVPPYFDDRVCDHVYRVLFNMVQTGATEPMPSSPLETDMSYEERDAEIAKFVQWWPAHTETVKARLPHRLADAQAVRQKLDALLGQLGN